MNLQQIKPVNTDIYTVKLGKFNRKRWDMKVKPVFVGKKFDYERLIERFQEKMVKKCHR